MFVWKTVRGNDDHVEIVDGWETLDAVIAEMAASSWEEPSNAWASYVTDEVSGEVVAMALFAPAMDLLVTVSDGRQLSFPVPAIYRDHGIGETGGES